MSNIIYSAIMPHPPIVVPFIGGDRLAEVKKTIDSLKSVAKKIKSISRSLDAIIVITPHGAVSDAAVPVYTGSDFTGNFSYFGFAKPNFSLKGAPEIASAIVKEAGEISQEINETGLDHGLLVPLYYPLQEKISLPLIPIAVGLLPLKKLFEFGKKIKQTVQKLDKKVAFIASADMSHRLIPGAPSGYSPKGLEFDQKLVKLVKNYDVTGILDFDKQLAEEAGQDALWSIAVLLGVLDGTRVKPEVLSYEGPFGVGYMVAQFCPETKE